MPNCPSAIYVVGYQRKRGVELEDYTDFPIGNVYTGMETLQMLKDGVFPPGIMLQMKGGPVGVVRGHYDAPQEIVKQEVER